MPIISRQASSSQDKTVNNNIPRPWFTLRVLGVIIVLLILLVFIIPSIFPAILIVEDFYWLLCDILIIFLLIKLVDRPNYNVRKTFKINKIQKFAILPLIIIGLGLAFFEGGVASVLQLLIGWPPEYWFMLEKPSHLLLQLSLGISVCITSPVWEELLFRGLIQSSIEGRYGIRRAIIFSSLLFSLGHVIPAMVFPLFLGSLVAGWTVYRTRSIFSGIMIHFIGNTIAVVYLFVSKENSVNMIDIIKTRNDLLENELYIIVGLIVVVIGIIWLRKLYRFNSSESTAFAIMD